MDFKQLIKDYNIEPRGVIQLGAHHWQEKEMFLEMGIKNFVLIEPQTECIEVIKTKLYDVDAVVYQCAVSNKDSKGLLYVDNIGMSASLLKPKDHLKLYPKILFNKTEEIQISTIASLPFDRSKYNILYMDIQGNELQALHGAEMNFLNGIDCIYTEINYAEMYDNCTLVGELDANLFCWGFKRVNTVLDVSSAWGNAFYYRN